MYEHVSALLMQKFEVEKLHMDSIMCYWKMLKNTTLKMVNFGPVFEPNRTWQNNFLQDFDAQICIICFDNDKTKAEKYRMYSFNCAKTRSMKFSAELMMKRAT